MRKANPSFQRWFGLLVVLFLLAAPVGSSFAFEDNAGKKLLRGVMNVAFGWMEVPIWVAEGIVSDHPVREPFLGFAHGVGRGVSRTLFGIGDMFTFIFPPYDEIRIEPEVVFGETP